MKEMTMLFPTTNGWLRFDKVLQDCVLFHTECIHHPGFAVKAAEKMAEITKSYGFDKAVLVGGCCDDGDYRREPVEETILKYGIKLIRIDTLGYMIRLVEDLIPGFKLKIEKWDDAVKFHEVEPFVFEMCHRKRETEDKIKNERDLLKRYPVCCRVQSIEWHGRSLSKSGSVCVYLSNLDLASFGKGFDNLFKFPENLTAEVEAVALFASNLEEGVLVIPGSEIHFKVVDEALIKAENRLALLRNNYEKPRHGSLRIQLDYTKQELSLYLHGGEWKVKEHPFTSDYVPLWKDWIRIEKVAGVDN